jgi:CHAD domain-containing protein
MTIITEVNTTETLLERYHVDLAHARHVADAALAIFDATGTIHRCGNRYRRLLEIGALLHNVGMTSDPERHHTVGRDIVLGTDFAELDEEDRALVACLVVFHRKKVRPSLEPAYLGLDKKARRNALRLAAMLRIADGADYSESQTSRLKKISADDDLLYVKLIGPAAAEEGARMLAKADLWQKIFGGEVQIETKETTAPADTPAEPAESTGETVTPPPLISGNEPLADVLRVMLRRHYQRFLAEERRLRNNQTVESVHQLRVAARRMRSVMRILPAVAPAREVRRFNKGLRQVAAAAGTVRDCDVFLERVHAYAAGLPDDEQPGMRPLINALERDRAAGLERLRNRIDSQRHENFKRDFAQFMNDAADGWDRRLRVRDLAGSQLWRHYEVLRAHETIVDMKQLDQVESEAIHDSRIDAKRLRYLLEIFGECADRGAAQLLDPLVALQDHIGQMQDLTVAMTYVADMNLAAHRHTVLESYVVYCQDEHRSLREALPPKWEKATGSSYRRKLMDFITKL